jgi:hypothetical protein
MSEEKPSLGTVLCAGTAAAFAAVTPMALLGLPGMNFPILLGAYLVGVPIALVFSWVLGLPAYFVLRERWALTWGRAALGGFVVGGVPAGLLSLPFADPPQASLGVFASVGFLGACGGLGFRAFLLACE